ncbi:MAG: FAD-linked oxidase C-terminal domain-containing protein, partial [Myxococcota bacterium]
LERSGHSHSDVMVVPISKMHLFLCLGKSLAEARGLRIAAYGHLGDGNLHLNRLAATSEEREQAAALRGVLLDLALSLGGTLTAEHGIGLTKRDELLREQSPELIALQRRIKRAFDPHGIMNPGKVWPVSEDAS